MTTTSFRILVVIGLLLGIGSAVCEFATLQFLPEPLREYREQRDSQLTPQLMILVFGALGILLLGLISTVGLLCLWRPARVLYTIVNVLAFPLTFLFGPVVSHGATHFLTILSTFLSGIIWALIYFSPIKEHFEDLGEPPAP